MKRRLMIARALVHQPRLLILDEPTAGVDIEIRRSMWEFLRRINAEGTTIILTTHYLEEAESLCRNIAIIDGGRIIESDRMSNLLRKLQIENFLFTLRNPVAAAPVLDGYTVRWWMTTRWKSRCRRTRASTICSLRLSAQGLDVLSMRNKVQPPGADVHAAGGEPHAMSTEALPLSTIGAMRAFRTIVIREFGRIIRIWGQTLVPSAVTTSLYFVIFGSLVGRASATWAVSLHAPTSRRA